VFAHMCIADFLERSRSGRVLIIVPTVALLDQWYVSLQDELGVPSDMLALYSGDEKPEHPGRINLLVINSARALAESVAAGSEALLIVDECHRAGSPHNAKALSGKYRATLGLSATPEREYDEGFHLYVEPALGPIIYTYDYRQAFADGVITAFDLINVKIDLLLSEREAYERLTKGIAAQKRREEKSDREVSMRLKRLLQRRAAVVGTASLRLPVAVKLVESHRGQRAIIFHERIDAAETLVNLLARRRHSVTAYHSGIGPAMRRENLRLYRRGVFDVIVCCRALDEGMNVPETSVGVIASSTASQRQRIQRLGRVLRPAPGKDRATIYTVYATTQESSRLKREADQLEGVASVTWSRSSFKRNG
jgi:superfamily II DNA or RNA helicase